MWNLTRNEFQEFKKEYPIFSKVIVKDRYGGESNAFTQTGSVSCMWAPVTDVALIETYGQDISKALQAIIYDDTPISEHDQTEIDGQRYEFYTIQKYQNFRLCIVRRVI